MATFTPPFPLLPSPAGQSILFLTPSLLKLPLQCLKLQTRRKGGRRKTYTCTTVPWRLFFAMPNPSFTFMLSRANFGQERKKRQGGREQERRKEPPFFWTVLENWHPLNEKSFLLCGQKKSSTILFSFFHKLPRGKNLFAEKGHFCENRYGISNSCPGPLFFVAVACPVKFLAGGMVKGKGGNFRR